MSHSTDPPSSKASLAQQTDDMPCSEHAHGNITGVAVMNPFLDRWLNAITNDGSLPSEAPEVARVMAYSVGIGSVSFTDWQRINASLGRGRRDLMVFEVMSELALAGYLDRNIDDRFGRSYGWSLLIPEGEL